MPQIILIHASQTGGHRSAAETLCEKLSENPEVQAEVINVFKKSGERRVNRLKLAAHRILLNKLSWIRSQVFYKFYQGSTFFYLLSQSVIRLGFGRSRNLCRRIAESCGDLYFCCDSTATAILNDLKRRGRIRAPINALVTDYRAHRFWSQKHVDAYYVPCSQTGQDLVRFGVDPGKIHVTGIPVRDKFTRPSGLDRNDLRRNLGIDAARFTILMLGGSLGRGPYEEVARLMNSVEAEIQVVFVTGNDSKKADLLKRLKTDLEVPIIVLGYSRELEKWIEACDIVITKPGGLTTSEIFLKKKPMIILRHKGYLQKIQTEFLRANRPSVRVCGLGELAELITELATEGERHELFKGDLGLFSRDGAAARISSRLLTYISMQEDKRAFPSVK
jgi:processive 1,2-diacylglycerol beta-glucosyltransferase